MMLFQRSRQFRHHRKNEALQYAHNAVRLAKRIDPGVELQVFTGVGDSVERVFWVGAFDGPAALEMAMNRIGSDKRWHAFILTAPDGAFVEGSVQNACMRAS